MKIHEYNEMMAYLTRPGMRTGGQIIGKPGGLVEPGVTNYGQKDVLADIFSITELDKGANFWFNKNWKEVLDAPTDDPMFERFKGKKRKAGGKTYSLTPKKAAITSIRRSLSAYKGVWKDPDIDVKLSPEDQKKLKIKYPEFADADFNKYRWGYDMYASKADKSKTNRIRYIVDELGFGGTKAGTLSPEKQADVLRIFGDEWQGKWDFNSYKYGLPDTGKGGKNVRLMKRIRNTIEEVSKIPEKVGYSYSVDENYLLNKFVEANKIYPDQYKLLKDPEGDLKGVSVKGQNYYHYKYPANLMKPGDKLITEHPSHDKVQKYLKFANEAKGNKSQFLTELFAKHNYKVPTINQLLRHFWNKEGTTTTRNAIQKHHPGRVENIPDHLQLLDEWKNLDARRIHGRVDNDLMSRADANIELKRKGIQIILDDGTKLGAPDINPEKQIRDYEKFVERKVKGVVKAGELPQLAEKLGLVKEELFNAPKATKIKIAKVLNCSFTPDMALGGRVGFAKGSNVMNCITSKLDADPQGTLSKVAQAVPETRGAILETIRPDLTAQGWQWADVEAMKDKPGIRSSIAARFPVGANVARVLFDPIELLFAIPYLGYEAYQGYKTELADVEEFLKRNKEIPEKYKPRLLEMFRKKSLGVDGGAGEGALAFTPEQEFTGMHPTLKQDIDTTGVEKGITEMGGPKGLDEYYQWMRSEASTIAQERFEQEKKEQADFEKRREEIREQEIGRRNVPIDYNEGGRVGLKKGTFKSGRRTFLKGVGATMLLPFVGKFFKFASKKIGGKFAGPVIQKTAGMPEWFPGLVKRLYQEGDDVTKKWATKDLQVVKGSKLESGDDVHLYHDLDTGNVRVEVLGKKNQSGYYSGETHSGAYSKEYGLEYRKGEDILDETTGKSTKVKDEFEVGESKPVMEDPETVGLEGDVSSVDDALSDLTELEAFAKKKTTTQIHRKKGTEPKDTSPEWEPPDYDYDID